MAREPTDPAAQPPDDTHEVREGARSAVAAGMQAVVQTARHAFGQAGVVRGTRALLRLNQMNGFDCPSCAWPDPDDDRSIAEFCENGAKAVASEATTRKVDPAFFARHSLEDLAARSDHWLNDQGRLTHPVVLRAGATHYEPIAWDAAFELVAARLNELASPHEAEFYTSGRTSNEAAFLYQLFVREFGTNNLPDCSNMCHESSGAALSATIGVGKGTVTLHDFDHADAIFLVGQNPGTNHPRMLSTLEKAARRGCRIVAVNPLLETGNLRFKHPQDVLGLVGKGTKHASLYLRVKINGDQALFRGIIKAMLAREAASPGSVLAADFLRQKTEHFEEFRALVEASSWQELTRLSGVPREQIEEAAEVALTSRATIVCWAMGLTQHRNGVATIQEVVNFLLLQGNFGRPGAGACPVRGHSNVQGDRTMGVWEKMNDAFLDRLGAEFDFAPPRAHGHDTVEAIEAMARGESRVFFGLGGNFLSAAPDTERTAAAMRSLRLSVQVSTKLNRGHLVTGKEALILPCLGRTEKDRQASGLQFVTVENSMSVVSASQGRLSPASEHLLSEPAIVARLAHATLGARSRTDWLSLVDDYDRIRERISRVVPGFDDFNARARRPGGFYLPNAVREGGFGTRSGKGIFSPNALSPVEVPPGKLLMMTLRSHDQYNTTIYGLDDRYRGIFGGRRVVFLHQEDAASLGFSAGQLVDLRSHFDGTERVARRFVVVLYDIPRGCAATYFPETNVLVPLGSVAEKSNTPASKSIIISLAPAAPDAAS